MKDSRIGESLWFEWDGSGFEPSYPSSNIYYTEGTVDLEPDIVRKALASSLQRDGIAISLANAFMMLNSSVVTYGYAGILDDEVYQTVCDIDGFTQTGEKVDSVTAATWVEVLDF
jgi:hypothetical protein